MKRKLTVMSIILILIVGVLTLSGCPSIFDSNDDLSSNKIQTVIAPEAKVEYTKGLGYYVTFTGALKNITNTKFTYVSITFTLYDENGYNIGTAMDNMNYLDAGGTWKYEAHSLQWFDEPPASYKCTDITCF